MLAIKHRCQVRGFSDNVPPMLGHVSVYSVISEHRPHWCQPLNNSTETTTWRANVMSVKRITIPRCERGLNDIPASGVGGLAFSVDFRSLVQRPKAVLSRISPPAPPSQSLWTGDRNVYPQTSTQSMEDTKQ